MGQPQRQVETYRRPALVTVAAAVAIVIAGCGVAQKPAATEQKPAAGAKASFIAKLDQAPMLMGAPDSHGVATYTVEFDVTNTSKVAGTPVCVLLNSAQLAAVPNGNVIRTIDHEAAGQTRTVFSGVAITGRGAAHATNWSIHCQQGTELPLGK